MASTSRSVLRPRPVACRIHAPVATASASLSSCAACPPVSPSPLPTPLRRRALLATRIHDLRHTAASLMHAEGIGLWKVSKTLGHAGIQITIDHDGHFLPEVQQGVGDRMDAMLASSGAYDGSG